MLVLFLPLALAACGAEPSWAPDEEVTRAIYRDDGPPSLTLFTVVSNSTGSGGHSALMVNASQRAIFDPAGTFQHPALPERNDVIFGMSDKAVDFYKDYHGRETWHVVIQEVEVSPEVAEQALRRIREHGPVQKSYCAIAVADVLRGLPGFQTMPSGFSPLKLMKAWDDLPGVKRDVFYDDSPADNKTIRAPANLL
nr:hypothetical protein [Pseudoruegeria sp. HB172150]